MSKQALVSLAILLALCYPVFFLHLNEPVMHLWDESSYAHNAMQMIKHKKPLVVYAFDVPDTYNTKPPFVVWMMAISI
jgi:4-amino-4-deoxy-L-arabinose transferase-like glycosyltransferase